MLSDLYNINFDETFIELNQNRSDFFRSKKEEIANGFKVNENCVKREIV